MAHAVDFKLGFGKVVLLALYQDIGVGLFYVYVVHLNMERVENSSL